MDTYTNFAFDPIGLPGEDEDYRPNRRWDAKEFTAISRKRR